MLFPDIPYNWRGRISKCLVLPLNIVHSIPMRQTGKYLYVSERDGPLTGQTLIEFLNQSSQ